MVSVRKKLPLTISIFIVFFVNCNHAIQKLPIEEKGGLETEVPVVNYQHDQVDKQKNEYLESKDLGYRLPKSIVPESYKIKLSPFIEEKNFRWNGSVEIRAHVDEKTDRIVLHQGRIDINDIKIRKCYNYTYFEDWCEDLDEETRVLNERNENLAIILKQKLDLSKESTYITIHIEFTSLLETDMVGFYSSAYIDDKGTFKHVASTQFKPINARHAFPCFDEPEFKATFEIEITRSKSHSTLSNMKAKSIGLPSTNGRVSDTYKTTHPMSTYSVAFVVSDFTSKNKDKITVWARSNAIGQTQYALDIGIKSQKYFSDLFNEQYDLEKIDMVAIPDLKNDAMDSSGLITFKESQMLYDPNESSDAAKQSIASVIVREWVHMWFGNLRTPKWWDNLWLSAGFAHYFQYYATANIEPSWKMEKQFVVDKLQSVFGIDGLDSSKSMTREVTTSGEIENSGDKITYDKGASIVRMMALTFGNSVFKIAIQNYLENKKFESAVPDDLWKAIQGEEENFYKPKPPGTVKEIMETWTTQAGFPVVSVKLIGNSVELKQERFFIRNPKNSPKNSTWSIPLTWTTQSEKDFVNTSPKHWLRTEKEILSSPVKDNEWIVFNIQQAGFYRVNYDKDTWYRIINVLNSDHFEDIDEINRAAIVDDLLNLARAGYLDYEIALDGLKYIAKEKNYIPIKSALAGLEYLEKRFEGFPYYNEFTEFVLQLISNNYAIVNTDKKKSENHLTTMLEVEINNWACKLNHDLCIYKSPKYFKECQRIPSTEVPKNHRPAIYCATIRHGSDADWHKLWKKYESSHCETEKSVILEALACSQKQELLEQYALLAITDFEKSHIRKHDSISVFDAISNSGQFGAEFILEFVEKHHLQMKKYYGGYDTVASIISKASERFSTLKLIEKFSTFIQKNRETFKPIIKSLEDSLSLAKFERDRFYQNLDTILQWIRKNKKNMPSVPKFISSYADSEKYRLPNSIVPESYKIMLTPHLEPDFTFDGIVEITTVVNECTSEIVLHTSEIVHNDIKLTLDGVDLTIISRVETKEYDILTITVSELLPIDSKLIIKIFYTGQLNSAMRGFYRSSYVDEYNNTRWLAATHLEPVGARKMFPCFDEPALKAKFQLSVRRSQGYEAISNTQITSKVTEGDHVLDIFAETPVMSTYLVAVIVSEFDKLTEKSIYSTYARPNAIYQAEYAVSVISPIIEFFEKSLGHKYQLSKLDMAAIPDFASGAMENWGLITYRETAMLYDEKHCSVGTKQSIINVIAHEISHQWFGNLVSPEWWKYTWLSEGFARYYQYHATATIEPSWKLESQFIVEQLHSAFGADGLPSSHPMTHDVKTPKEISAIFDTISYAKAASVLRMMKKSLGSKIFDSALNSYLKNREYKSANPDHLVAAIQEQVDKQNLVLETTVKKIMDSWTTQAGYPVIHVKRSKDNIELSQKRFLLENPDGIETNIIWWVPITWASKSKPSFSDPAKIQWFSKSTETLKISNPIDEWFILNVQQAGYYRVNYDTNSWETIIKALKSDDFEKIHEINRASLMDDLLNLARVGMADYAVALSATEYLAQENNYIPWRASFMGFEFLDSMFVGKDIHGLYKTHILTTLKPIYEKLGFEEIKGESHTDKILRRYIFSWACRYEDQKCIMKSKDLFSKWRTDETELVPVNIRNTVYCMAIKYGTSEDWEFLLNKQATTNVRTEKETITSALACSKDPKILYRYLRYAINKESKISIHSSNEIFTAIYKSGEFGAEFVFDFIKSNYRKIHKYFEDYDSISKILEGILEGNPSKNLIPKLTEFYDLHRKNHPEIEKPLQTYSSRAEENVDWYRLHSPRIFEWLDKKYPSSDHRLPASVRPLQYDIYLTPNLEEEKFIFDGEVRIKIEAIQDTSSVVLHANHLTINEVTATIDSVQGLEVSSYGLNSTTHKFSIYFKSVITAKTTFTVNIKYSGILNDRMEGFYRSYYYNDAGEKKWLASTQFQRFGARQAFPCFDEPALKAKFIINIKRPSELITLSNMLLPNPGESNSWDTYEESVPMSSYLVAFVVSDFKSIANERKNFRIWARPNAIEHAHEALNVGEKILSFFESYTGIEFPIEKMDLVAVPDFAAGAMENWGLITFREYGLLTKEGVTSTYYTRYMNTIIAHEIAHMWFGNLVTCHWWDRLWLNEGFAQYLQWIAVDSIHPDWKVMDQFSVYELQVALLKDSTSNMRAMNNIMKDPYDNGEGNSAIIYGKAASVIHMMDRAFGEKIFTTGLKIYLNDNRYGTGTAEKLWSALQTSADSLGGLPAVNESVATLMDSWASQPGYPVVHVSVTKDWIELDQERFLITGRDTSADTRPYWIPISFATQTNSQFKQFITSQTMPIVWFGKRTEKFTNNFNINPNEWFIMNVKQSGFYRVNYDRNSWQRLMDALEKTNFSGIHEINRAQIVDDLLNLARGDYISYDLALMGTKFLKKEVNFLPWKSFFNGISFLYERFDGQDIEPQLKKYVLELIDNVYNHLGFQASPGETQMDGLNRQLIISWACKFEHSDCVEKTKRMFKDFQQDERKLINPDVKPAVYCTALKYGDYDDWMFLWQQYRATNFESEKIIILNALGCTRNQTALNYYFNIALSNDDSIRDQNRGIVFSSVSSADGFGVNATLNFLMDNYTSLYEFYHSWSDVASLFTSTAAKISTSYQLQELSEFIDDTPKLAEIAESVKSSIRTASQNLDWYKNHSQIINAWFDKPVDKNEETSSSASLSRTTFFIMILTGLSAYFLS